MLSDLSGDLTPRLNRLGHLTLSLSPTTRLILIGFNIGQLTWTGCRFISKQPIGCRSANRDANYKGTWPGVIAHGKYLGLVVWVKYLRGGNVWGIVRVKIFGRTVHMKCLGWTFQWRKSVGELSGENVWSVFSESSEEKCPHPMQAYKCLHAVVTICAQFIILIHWPCETQLHTHTFLLIWWKGKCPVIDECGMNSVRKTYKCLQDTNDLSLSLSLRLCQRLFLVRWHDDAWTCSDSFNAADN